MGSNINILHVTQYLGIGGLENLILDFCLKTNQSKFSLHVLCLVRYDQNYKNRLEEHGITVDVISKKHKFDITFFVKLILFFKHKKIDIIHSHGGSYFDVALCAKLANVPKIIYTAHGLPVEHGLQNWFEDIIFSFIIDRIIVVSQEIKTYWQTRLPYFKNKVDIIINGINTNLFKPNLNSWEVNEIKQQFNIPIDKFIIGSVGRLEKVKNYYMLIQTLEQLITKYEKIHLIFIGDGRQREWLEKASEQKGLTQHISFLGEQYNIYHILPILDIFLLSSYTEGTSLSLLEAQACGIPAIVTCVGGNVDIIKHGENGFLCEINEAMDMADKISLLITDQVLFKKMQNNARNTIVNHFDQKLMIEAYEKLYEYLIVNHRNYYD